MFSAVRFFLFVCVYLQLNMWCVQTSVDPQPSDIRLTCESQAATERGGRPAHVHVSFGIVYSVRLRPSRREWSAICLPAKELLLAYTCMRCDTKQSTVWQQLRHAA